MTLQKKTKKKKKASLHTQSICDEASVCIYNFSLSYFALSWPSLSFLFQLYFINIRTTLLGIVKYWIQDLLLW